jgi:hypothetical protein
LQSAAELTIRSSPFSFAQAWITLVAVLVNAVVAAAMPAAPAMTPTAIAPV